MDGLVGKLLKSYNGCRKACERGMQKMKGKTLADVSTGPDWLLYVMVALFAALSLLLMAGKGSWLIAGYNTASEKEKQAYNEKLLCRVVGGGMAGLTAALLFMAIFEDALPASFSIVFGTLTIVVCIVIIVLGNTVCRKKDK